MVLKNPISKHDSQSGSETPRPRSILRVFTYLATSIQFALALRLSNLSEASRVLSFLILPIHRGFDPSLALVAVGALSVGIPLYQYARGNEIPRLGGKWSIPRGGEITSKLLIGSTIFGIGWGMAGICRKTINTSHFILLNFFPSWPWSREFRTCLGFRWTSSNPLCRLVKFYGRGWPIGLNILATPEPSIRSWAANHCLHVVQVNEFLKPVLVIIFHLMYT